MEAFGTGTMVDVLRHVGMVACDSEMIQMSAMTDASWFAQSLSTLPGTPSGPAALQGFILCRVFLTSVDVILRGESSDEISNLVMVLVFDALK